MSFMTVMRLKQISNYTHFSLFRGLSKFEMLSIEWIFSLNIGPVYWIFDILPSIFSWKPQKKTSKYPLSLLHVFGTNWMNSILNGRNDMLYISFFYWQNYIDAGCWYCRILEPSLVSREKHMHSNARLQFDCIDCSNELQDIVVFFRLLLVMVFQISPCRWTLESEKKTIIKTEKWMLAISHRFRFPMW